MAKGYQQNRERKEAVAALGKTLTRRSSSHCELCGAGNERLTVMELKPLPDKPDPDRAVFLCKQCEDGMADGKLDPQRWRFLESVIWSEIPVVQVAAVRICRRLRDQGTAWAGDLLENIYLAPEIEEWLK